MFPYYLCIAPSLVGVLCFRKLNKLIIYTLWTIGAVSLFLLVPEGSRDIATYVSSFDEVQSMPLHDLLFKDPLFYLTTYIFAKVHFPAQWFFILLACLALLIKFKAISRLTNKSIYAVLLYMSSYFYLHEFTQIRIALALGTWMFALSYLEISPKRYLLLSLLASSIHLAAILSFFSYIILRIFKTPNRRIIFLAIAIVIVILGLGHFLENIGDSLIRSIPDPRTDLYFSMREHSNWDRPNSLSITNIWAIGTAMIVLLPSVGRFFKFRPTPLDYALTQSILVGSMALSILASMPIAAYRVSEFFLCLLPVQFARILDVQTRPVKVATSLIFSLVLGYAYVFKFQILIPS